MTREAKGRPVGREGPRRTWDARLSQPDREALAVAHRRGRLRPRPERGEGAAVDHAVTHCFTREAVVPERKLLTEALKHGIGTVTVDGVRRELACRPLVRAERDGRAVASSPDMLAWETRLIAIARAGRGRFRPLGDPARPCSRTWLNDGQK